LEANKDLFITETKMVLRKKVTILIEQGEYTQAETILQIIKNISERLGDKQGIASSLDGLGIIRRSQNKLKEAWDLYQESLKLYEELNDKEGIAGVFRKMGYFYFSQANFVQALEYFEKDLKLAEEINDKAEIARAMYSIGLVRNKEYKYEQAMELFQKCLKLYEETNSKLGVSRVYLNFGDYYRIKGNNRKSMEYYQKSLSIFEQLKAKKDIAITLQSMSLIYFLQGDFDQAFYYSQRSLSIVEEVGDKIEIGNILFYPGYGYYLQQNYDKAMEYFQRLLSLGNQLNSRIFIGYALHGIALTHNARGEYDQALKLFKGNLAVIELFGYKFALPATLNSIAEIYLLQGKNEDALRHALRSIDISKQLNDYGKLWMAHLITAKACQALKRPEEGCRSLEEAIQIIETTRAQIAGGEQTYPFFFEDKIAPYHQIIDLLVSQNRNNEALLYAERAKARSLLDALQGEKINIIGAMTAQDQEQEKRLNGEVVSLNSQIYLERQREKPNKATLSGLETHLEKARLELNAFQTQLYASHPELRIERAEMQPVTIEDMPSLMPDTQSALLEFVVGEDQTHLFVITQDRKIINLKVYTLDIKGKDLADRVNRFRKMMAEKDLAFRKPARELYDLLLKPAQQQLKGRTTLVIVPEGVLWELPFQVLQPSQTRYLLEDHTIFYTPSLTALREMIKRHNNNGPDHTLLAVGNPAFGKQPKEQVKAVLLDGKLEPLPGTEEQVRSLARLYGKTNSKFYTGQNAREEQIKSEAGKYKILQFATHGILNNRNPMYSYLVLSQAEENSKEDGLLEAREIMQMELKGGL
jgi:tetratricopeptide (TPR) repeat protein